MDLLQYGFFQHALLGLHRVDRRQRQMCIRDRIGVGVLSRDESDLDGNVVFRALRIRGGVGEQDTECA